MKFIVSCIYYIVVFVFIILSKAEAFPRATSAFVIDAEKGTILTNKNSEELMYPASLTKVMTLYITFTAIENGVLDFDSMLTVSRTAANRSPSKLGLRAGDKISVRDAVMALIVKSANDCATVLAENIGYSEENFAKTMTEVAKQLGMKNTTFKNASGLPNKEQKTTARDMSILALAMYHHFPQYYDLFSTKTFVYNGQTYHHHNELLNTFAGADGLKTGFTNAAGYNIITSAKRNGQRIVAVTMGHKTSKDRDKSVASLMDNALVKLESDTNQYNLATAYHLNHNDDNNFSIQIGAFSNYAKARKYAKQIAEEYIKNDKQVIAIETVKNDNIIIYRSKIIGFTQIDAEKVCKHLQKTNTSCIVTAESQRPIILAQK